MITTELTLSENEYLQDKMPAISASLTLIEAPTGVGKSTWALEELVKQGLVLMLVPVVLQIRQLQAAYKDRADLVVLSGSDNANAKDKADRMKGISGKSIVATYDLLPQILNVVDSKKYTLVVDEVHKVYAAGSYRDEALNPVLASLLSKSFKQVVVCTATYTPMMGKLAGIVPDSWFKVFPAKPRQRSLEVIRYTHSSKYHWLKSVMSRLESMKANGCRKLVFVRLNSTKRMEQAAAYLEQAKYKVLMVSRGTAGKAAVKQTLEQERLPGNYDVVLTTSIMDEAINLQNQTQEIDSVHIVDPVAHPEELVQFLGRLRKASPPCFLHMYKSADDKDFMATLAPDDAERQEKKLSYQHRELLKFSDAAKSFAENIELDKGTYSRFMAEINETLKRFVGANLLQEGKFPAIEKNKAGLLAVCYRNDMYRIYSSFGRLQQRLQALLPSLNVTYTQVDESPCPNIQKVMDVIEDSRQRNWERAVTEVCQLIEDDWKDVPQPTKPEIEDDQQGVGARSLPDQDDREEAAGQKESAASAEGIKFVDRGHTDMLLYEYVSLMDEAQESGEPINPFGSEDKPLHYKAFFQALELAHHFCDLKDIHTILLADECAKALDGAKSYDDMLARAVRAELKKRLANNLPKVTGKDAVQIVKSAFKVAAKRQPLLDQVVKKKTKLGITKDDDGELQVEASKAMNFISSLALVEDKNANKPELRYLILKNENWRGYRMFCPACEISPKLTKAEAKLRQELKSRKTVGTEEGMWD